MSIPDIEHGRATKVRRIRLTVRRSIVLLLLIMLLWKLIWLLRMEPRRQVLAQLAECGCQVPPPEFVSEVAETDLEKTIDGWERSDFIASIRYLFPVEAIVHNGSNRSNNCRFERIRFSKLSHFPELKELSFGDCSDLTSAHLEGFPHLRRLESLYLDETAVNDQGLEHLSGLTNLRRLVLSSTNNVTGEGLRFLTCEHTLEELSFRFAVGVTDAGLWELRRFKKLKTLNLSLGGADLNGHGFAVLRELPNLREVTLPIEYREHWEPHVSHIPKVYTE